MVKAVVQTHESLTVGVKTVYRSIHREHCIVIAALTVFGLVINSAADDLYFANAEIALEVGHIIISVPQAELHKREELHVFFSLAAVAQHHAVHFAIAAQRHKRSLLDCQPVFLRRNDRIAHAMTALIVIQICLDGHPAGRPDRAVVVQIEIASAGIGGNVIVAVTGQAEHTCVLIEAVTAGSVGEQGEKLLASQIVNPRVGRVRPGDDVLPALVVKKAELHGDILLQYVKWRWNENVFENHQNQVVLIIALIPLFLMIKKNNNKFFQNIYAAFGFSTKKIFQKNRDSLFETI